MDSQDPVKEDEFLDPLIGTMVGRFRVERKIGQGGMGAVYALLQPAIHKRMALKLLHEHYAARKDIVQRFFGEARAVNLIGHPNIVDISDFSHLPDGRPFIIMEFLEGQSLEEYLEEHGALSVDETVYLLKQICSALGAAHAKSIYHRDVKPENFFITKSHDGTNFLKVLDFGIAKLKDERSEPEQVMQTATGIVLGTPTYMSPEQAEGNTQGADQRTDIYSLGVVLYQMLTGSPPFVGQSFAELIIKHVQQQPPSLRETRDDLPPAWDLIIAKALAKKPDDRYQSMAALYKDALAAQTQLRATTLDSEGNASKLPKKLLWLVPPALLALAITAFLVTQKAPTPTKARGPILTSDAGSVSAQPQVSPTDAGPTMLRPTSAAPVKIASDAAPEVATAEPAVTARPEVKAPTAKAPIAKAPIAKAPIAEALIAEAPIAKAPTAKAPTAEAPIAKRNRGKGTLTISAAPWAKVYVNGKLVGPTPKRLNLPVGTHKIRFENTTTGKSVTKRATIKKGVKSTMHHKWQ